MPSYKIYNFDSGEFGVDKLPETSRKELQLVLKGVINTLKDNPTVKFDIIIQGSESKVTNPKGFEKKGSLGKARAEAVLKYITTDYNYIITESNPPKSRVKIIIPESKIGISSYDSRINNKGEKKYFEEQYVEITIQQDIQSLIKKNICDGKAVAFQKELPPSSIPPDFKVYESFNKFPDDFKNGWFVVSIESFVYPDALEIALIGERIDPDTGQNIVNKTAWIPLFSSEKELLYENAYITERNLWSLHKAYKSNPTSPLFTYLQIIKAEGIYLKQSTATLPYSERRMNAGAIFNYEYTSSTNEKDAKRIHDRAFIPFKGRSLDYIERFNEIPLYNIEDQDLNTYPPRVDSPKIIPIPTGYKREMAIQKTEQDIEVRLRVYGFVEGTVLKFESRCEPSTYRWK